MPNEDIHQRLQYLEEQLAHEQHTVRQLNEIVIQLRGQTEQLAKQLSDQKDKMEVLEHRLSEDLPHEKPPHY